MSWEQWRTILWLRWRLTRNQWKRFGPFNEAAGILLGLCLAAGIVISCAAGAALAILPGIMGSPLLIAWDAIAGLFLLFWLTGLLTEIQRSESIDLTRLMHLPVSLRSVFFFNYLASWITPSILIALPGCVCFSVALAVTHNVRMLWMIPVVLGYFSLVTAWTYLLRGWLVALMINERHRRTILTGAALLIIIITQLPNLYFQMTIPAGGKPRSEQMAMSAEVIRIAHIVLPPLWTGKSAQALAGNNVIPAVAASGTGFLLAAAALLQAYRATRRFYHGGATAAPVRRRAKEKAGKRSRMVEWHLPGVPEEPASVALATFRSYLRAPEIKMAMFGQVMMNVFLAVIMLRPGGLLALAGTKPILGSMIAIFSLFGAAQLLFNQFGFDRDGFRAYVLSPVGRRNILLGKNLAALPFVASIGMGVLTLAFAFGKIDRESYFTALLMFASGFLLFAILGNFLSIMSPCRVAQGSLRPTKLPPKAMLMIFVGLILSTVLSGFLFLPWILAAACSALGWVNSALIHIGASILLLLSAGSAYAGTVGPLGRLLQRREREILQTVTSAIE